MRRINLFSGPGSGKSAVAAKIFSYFKTQNLEIDLVKEYIKTWAYQKIKADSFDQLYIFSKQLRSEDILLRNGVDYIVTDSPLILQLAYMKKYDDIKIYNEMANIAAKFEEKYPSINIFLDRKDIPYKSLGRYESYEDAVEMDKIIEDTLNQNKIPFKRFDSVNHNHILNFLTRLINGEE